MPAAAIHIIQRQVFELSTPNSTAGFDCQQLASAWLQQIIIPQVEACFNELPLGNQHLVIDKLEIDLGSFDRARFEKEAAAKLKEILSRQLQSYLGKTRTAARKTMETTGATEATSATEATDATETPDSTVHLINDVKAIHSVLRHFLLHGRFPWWHKTPQLHIKPETHFNIELISALEPAEKNTLKELLQISQAARIRLATHFGVDWLGSFLQSLGLSGLEAARQWQILLPAINHSPSAKPLFHQHFWIAWIEAIVQKRQTINITLLIEKAAGGYNDTAIAVAQAMYRICVENSSHAVWAGYAESIQKYLRHKIPYDDFRKQWKEPASVVSDSVVTNIFNNEPSREKIATPDVLNGMTEDEALFVPAAGLVILHPFLTELFASTGLWVNKQWRVEESVFQAIQLLSQLAFGEPDIPEYQLSFIKVLAGVDIDTPLPAQPILTDEELNTCTELLQATIEHWTALRNSSPAALQEGFLQRQGKLTKDKKGYHLVVERLAQDVLLSRLPWGYSMIKLPWMNHMLHVTWL